MYMKDCRQADKYAERDIKKVMMLPPTNHIHLEEYARLQIKEKERERDLRLALKGISPRRSRLSSRAEALIALIVVLLLIVGMLVWYYVIL